MMKWLKRWFGPGEFPVQKKTFPAPPKPIRNGATEIKQHIDTNPKTRQLNKNIEEALRDLCDYSHNGPKSQERRRIRELRHKGMLLQENKE